MLYIDSYNPLLDYPEDEENTPETRAAITETIENNPEFVYDWDALEAAGYCEADFQAVWRAQRGEQDETPRWTTSEFMYTNR